MKEEIKIIGRFENVNNGPKYDIREVTLKDGKINTVWLKVNDYKNHVLPVFKLSKNIGREAYKMQFYKYYEKTTKENL